MKSILVRLLSKYKVDESSGCWNWTGDKYRNGYGRIREGGASKRLLRVHRVSFERHKGPIPAGLVVMHECDNKACINPAHLSVGTVKQNINDAIDRGLSRPFRAGVLNSSARLDCERVQQIRQDYSAGGISQRVLAQMHGVAESTIQALIGGRSWKSD
ncbi:MULTISPECIES: HNH endonuclease [unclassified Polaromonas]|jgi:DNA-binding transcriptional regulator YiaG|uniref:HNH endonuclease signature motif containing protein n=1 Tax=unclassified Polaromonas TaxID=2638319 RepID=UPI000BC8BFDA|nr:MULTISPECIES: HNH endonuclease [unclassified Polaromonas]OYY34774.1 MAG: hypothetical protein B7Y60_15155 [Polaromonas sp. 35-63-35]OYZ19339.1 MAG: hypothetical protein B7Y28_12435 [Polaromonas sp. 16-63-31]OYZ77535.1 MAG: hypothetical protein B7Y09_16315 [Polaromonas sp. 24-63-21]OZA48482.1 MAG: hypothetical protein B7X88_18205 [Polaromonas sp. 17-63-33]OZA87230.1 MAG: hypothetical protein B7X65_13675 [Polaromonas sp. 39-63-25]